MGLTVDAVRTARNPQEAMLLIAAALDRIEAGLAEIQMPTDSWSEWGNAVALNAPFTVEVVEDGDTDRVTIAYKLPSLEKLTERRTFAKESLELDKHFPEIDAITAYAKGGPLWLYHGNRDFVMSLHPTQRQVMVADVQDDDPDTAAEMGRDVLKDEDPGNIAGAERALAGTDVAGWSQA